MTLEIVHTCPACTIFMEIKRRTNGVQSERHSISGLEDMLISLSASLITILVQKSDIHIYSLALLEKEVFFVGLLEE